MTPIRLLAVSSAALAITACSSTGDGGSGGGDYNPPPVTTAQAAPATQAAANPTYDTPAAYEESTGARPAPEAIVDPGLDSPRSTAGGKPSPGHAGPAIKSTPGKPSAAPVAGGASHTVVKGDTLGGIAKKYGVTQAAIMKANNMSKDTVVLGKQLVIPGH